MILIKIVERITKINLFLASISLIFMTLIIFIEIISRSFLGFSTLIADEMSGYFNVAIAFFGLAYTFQTDGFIRISFLYDRFSKRWRKLLNFVSMLAALVYSLVLLRFFWFTVKRAYIGKATSLYISKTPLYIPQSVMVIGIIALILQIMVEISKEIIKFKAESKGGR